MLSNIQSAEELKSSYRFRRKHYITKTVMENSLAEHLKDEWKIEKRNLKTTRLRKEKDSKSLLSDRIWCLLYQMKFDLLSDEGGANLKANEKDENSKDQNIDLVAIDEEIALAIKSISLERRTNRPQLQSEISEFNSIRGYLANVIKNQFPGPYKRQIVQAIFISNISLSDSDKEAATKSNIILFDENDLVYYEKLASHIGPASKYQFFADMLPGKQVPGLSIRIPAIKTRMGGFNCYEFSISPEYLLKISYISHRTKGKASDVDTYQRMVSKPRLDKIKQYISDNGIFPTNIVLNLDQKLGRVRFEKIKQDYDSDGGLLGWLEIQPSYKSAWIIDGQHRLYAYSGHEKSQSSRVSVLAFEGLKPSMQAQLFVDINAKQKSVNQSLLQELYAELHWDSPDTSIRINSIISKAVQQMGEDPDSPFYDRIQTAEAKKDTVRCITSGSIFSALEKNGFFILKTKKGSPLEHGPLWGGSNEATLKRSITIINGWFEIIKLQTFDWWEKGAGEGGGLAMNDGVTTCLNVLKSVFTHLDNKGIRLIRLTDDELFTEIKPYAIALAKHLSSLNEAERKRFRDLRGVQGQTTRTKRCQQAIHNVIADFAPQGLKEFINSEKAETNKKAKTIVDWIETNIQKFILEELKREYGSSEMEWWLQGVPKNIRTKASERFEQNDGQRGKKEYYFDLMDYRKIIMDNWMLFEKTFAYQKSGNKEVRTSWLNSVNNMRNIVSHVSSAMVLSIEELDELEGYEQWLKNQLELHNLEEVEV
ncbi:DGQHR domain-containing protein [Paenibacillus sp. FSL W7-1088]|uniref:DGQHR domain-containing protein n=1 Tax=Paenibacillus sp. FSL W7-1088 TaxID=2921695 RepID=UPI0030EC2229